MVVKNLGTVAVFLVVFNFWYVAHCGNDDNTIEPVEQHYEGKGSVYADDLAEAGAFLKHFDTVADDLMYKNALANWDYETDLSDKNLQKTIDNGLTVSEFFLKSSENASQIKTLDLPYRMQRQISWIRRSADPTSDEMRREIKETIGKMTSIFGKGKVVKKSKNYTLNDLTDTLRSSKKRSELDWAWKAWRDAVGPPIKALYGNLVDLLNIGAREHGWIDYGNYLRSDYEMGDDFELSLDKVWNEIEPLYQELHAYVRFKLSKVYKLKPNACLPANLMGDMFAQDWENIFHLVKPSKNSRTFDVTKELKKQKYTVKKMFQLAEKFFVSLGLSKMPSSFWEKSVFTKRKNKEMVCHASAWDVSSTDVRIKMCTKVRQTDLTTVHHEMGHIEYYLAYKDQPSTFRAGANPGFHEAIGDTISLSVETASYLEEVGLLKSDKLNKEDTISFLLNQALRRVAPIPYNLLVDKWRWRVYEGNITENAYNREWWKLRVRYQGVEPPVTRPESSFDPASKFHIGANSPYISYFVSYVLQFQLHKAFCKEAGFTGPLHACSIYKSEAAGKKLRKMLEAGRSEPWSKILKETIGERDLKASAILQYFDPLIKWLKEQRKKENYPLGWKNKLSTPVAQRKTKHEQGQERSGILKTNSGDVSLSINIPAKALGEILGKSDVAKLAKTIKEEPKLDETASSSDKKSADSKSTKGLDLTKLLSSDTPMSIKSVETNIMGEKGTASKSVKEMQINSLGSPNADNEESTSAKKTDVNEEAIASLIAALRGGMVNTSQNEDGNTPSAARIHPTAKFPSVAATINEEKKNPTTAGISPEVKNPTAAGVAPAPKANYVPPNQIALVPISLPGNLLSQLTGSTNATTSKASNTSTSNDMSLALPSSTSKTSRNETTPSEHTAELSKPINNQTTSASTDTTHGAPETSKVSSEPTHSAPEPAHISPEAGHINTETNHMSSEANHVSSKPSNLSSSEPSHTSSKFSNESSLSLANSTKSEAPSLETSKATKTAKNNETVPTEATANNEQNAKSKPENETNSNIFSELSKINSDGKNNSLVVLFPTFEKQTESKGFTSKETVSPCKRDDTSPGCMQSKIVTEGNSIPDDTKPSSSKNTISISPAVLIQKLIEHKVAEKSTPDPVVNAIPDSQNKDHTKTRTKDEGPATPTAEAKPESATLDMTKLISALTGGAAAENLSTEAKAIPTDAKDVSDQPKTSSITASNCTTATKRGFSINFDCPDSEKHKGGTLSITPSELLQKLLGGPKRSDINKNSLSSARVIKTDNGIQLSFDLNQKDKIPPDFSIKMTNPQGRQQHVDVLNTPKGMVVKPKSSLQLLTPLFVPVQNKDVVELGKDGK